MLAFEIEPPSFLSYLFKGACAESRSEEEFLGEAKLVSRYSDLIRISEALPEQPYLSSLTSLGILRRARLNDVKTMCSIRATEMNLNALIQHIGEALLYRCDYLVLEGSFEEGRDLSRVIEAFTAVKNLGLTDYIKIGLEVYARNRALVDVCVKAEPSFLNLRILDMDEIEEGLWKDLAAPFPLFIRLPMFDLTGLGLMSSKAIEVVSDAVSKILSDGFDVMIAAPHGFEEAFAVLKRVRGEVL